VKWIKDNNRYPINNPKYGKEERKMYCWLNEQKNAVLQVNKEESSRCTIYPEVIDYLNEHLPEWIKANNNDIVNTKRNNDWELRRQDWIRYYEKLGHKPRYSSNDNEEKRMAKWQYRMMEYYRKRTLSEDKIKTLENTYGWKWEIDVISTI
jgi:hypothetical protein